uniref:Uncharacterized protein n=1 Tax=Arundo donax TaxID=35708 RepID=A0A0A9HLN0_ARUDO
MSLLGVDLPFKGQAASHLELSKSLIYLVPVTSVPLLLWRGCHSLARSLCLGSGHTFFFINYLGHDTLTYPHMCLNVPMESLIASEVMFSMVSIYIGVYAFFGLVPTQAYW